MPAASERPPARERFFALLAQAIQDGSLVRVSLGGHLGDDRTLKNVLIRPVALKPGLRLSFVFRHATRDITKNFAVDEGLQRIASLVGTAFRTAHLSTTQQIAQLEYRAGHEPRLTLGKARQQEPVSLAHDRSKSYAIVPEKALWLRDLGVTTPENRVAKGMEGKFRQIQKFVELLQALLAGTQRIASADASPPLTLVDMGSGKGYLTFAAYDWLRRSLSASAQVLGIEARPELVESCNQAARKNHLAGLRFQVGHIADTVLDRVDALIALHACDTATDDAIARGIRAGASLIVVAPCCHKELRPQIRPPPVLSGALRHGILLEREAEFVTDALRAALLEWAGYDTRVFEFVSTEHTSKNLMIAAIKRRLPGPSEEPARRARELAAFYGVRTQRLADQLEFPLCSP